MQKLLLSILAFVCVSLNLNGMDFGLRFNSHGFPPTKRTSVEVGKSPYRMKKEFKMGFFFNFYAMPMFGNIVNLTTDDGQHLALVASLVDDGSFRIALVANEDLYYVKTPLTFDPLREDHLAIVLDKVNNVVKVKLNNAEMENPMDLGKTTGVTVIFGKSRDENQPDVAPIELRNARIFLDGANTNHWDFKYHDTPTTTPDDIGGVSAVVTNPHWLIDDHTDWKEIYSLSTKDRIQTAFNPEEELIYIIGSGRTVIFNPLRGDSVSSPVNGGNRVMAFSNHVFYSPTDNSLVNYNLNRRISAKMPLSTKTWAGQAADEKEEPNYSNHAVAVSGDTLFTFGGYGFYKYHNDLFTVDLRTGEIKEHTVSPALMPMTSAAAGMAGGKLYIFGGKGNDTGRQELPCSNHYALYEYDTDTWQGRKVWELDSVKYDFLPTQSMYYDEDEDGFYMAVTSQGGEMMGISRTKPEIRTLSTPIMSKMDFHDFVFDLYRSKDGIRYYLVIDKRLDPIRHDLKIYTISAPFVSDTRLLNDKILVSSQHNEAETGWPWWFYVVIIAVLLALTVALLFSLRQLRHRRNESEILPAQSTSTVILPVAEEEKEGMDDVNEESVTDNATPADDSDERSGDGDFSFITLGVQNDESRFFDRGHASISLLGGFCVRDKQGNDISVKFTARLKHLLILLLLSSLRYESGIKYQMIDEEIWGDKDDKAAQNNRNVSMRKLRMLLEEVGNVVISYDKGFFRIETNEVMFDYEELKTRIDGIKKVESVNPEMVNQIIELLLMGPMLPNTNYDWLDNYKAEFSSSALEMLTKLLKYEIGRDDNLAYRIAETMSLHDTLNEEALFAKCSILTRRKMFGLAKNVHARFCREYLKSMGEEYCVGFAEACRKNY